MLADTECKSALCPDGKKRVRVTDGGGLYLEAVPNGSKRWFWKYLFAGKEKRLALGSYPDVTLKVARMARDDARKQQQAGMDPALRRRLDKLSRKVSADSTFEAVAREYHQTKVGGWSEHYGKRWSGSPARKGKSGGSRVRRRQVCGEVILTQVAAEHATEQGSVA